MKEQSFRLSPPQTAIKMQHRNKVRLYHIRYGREPSTGCRVVSVVAEASDFVGPLTNAVTVYDFLGRVVSVATPLGVTSNFYDGASSRRLRVSRSDSPDTLTVYDALGNQIATVIDIDGDGQVGYAGNDRISATETHHEPINGDWWHVTSQSIWTETGVNACLTVGVSRVRLTGLGDWDTVYGGILISQRETLDARSNVTHFSTYVNAAQAMATQVTETPDSVLPAVTHAIAGHAVWQASATAVTNAFAYDGFARQVAIIDGRSNTALTHYNALGQVDYVENAAGNSTAYGYDDFGRRDPERGSHLTRDRRLGPLYRLLSGRFRLCRHLRL